MARAATVPSSIPEPVIQRSEFEKFRDFFYRKTGIHFDDAKRHFVDRRLIQRIVETGHERFRDYFTYMRFQASEQEFQQIVNLMTVNETYFFREEYQFKCMTETVLDEVWRHKTATDPIRIWSIPSSTGEEPYSIVLYLLENWPGIEEADVELVASDIDTQVLQSCRRGIYGKRSVQNLPAHILQKYFESAPGGKYRISKDLRSAVTFCTVNLGDARDAARFRGFDLVFCRNLLIYFDNAAQRAAVEALYDALNPGGFLFLGHSESMSRMSSLFKVRKMSGTIVYQKPR